MAVEERRFTRQGAERKRQLLDAAAELFTEHGYADTRVVDIVARAGVAKGLFYWYFENKEAVYRELVESARHELRRVQGAAIDGTADPLTRLRQGVESSIRFMGEQRRLYALFELGDNPDPTLAQLVRQGATVHVHDTANHVRAGIEAGLIRDDDPVLLAQHVIGTVVYLSHVHRLGHLDHDLEALAAFAGRAVVRALAANDGVASRAGG